MINLFSKNIKKYLTNNYLYDILIMKLNKVSIQQTLLKILGFTSIKKIFLKSVDKIKNM